MEAKTTVKKAMARFAPPPDLLPSEWANEFRRLSPESSARHGRFRIELTPFMREPMDCIKDPSINGFVMQKSAQVAYSEMLNNIIGYNIHLNPGPMMMMQPTLEMAEGYSKDRIAPMIRDSPSLAERIDDRSRTSGNTILHKIFPGGLLQLVGANSPASLASRPIRDLYCDEVDRNPRSAGKEGDPIWLAEQRQTTFFDRLKIEGGTPTVKGASRIVKSHEKTDQRVYLVPCPRCKTHIELQPSQLERDEGSEHFGKYKCQECGKYHEDWEKFDMIKDEPAGGTAHWKPTKPEVEKRGYFIWAAYSPFKTYAEICKMWNDAEGDPELEQVFWNTMLGLDYEWQHQELDAEELFKRREDFDGGRVPEEVCVITAGVDTQDNRFEGEIVGWGPDEESWSLDFFTIEGDPNNKSTRDKLDQYLRDSVFHRVDGVDLKIQVTFIDTGGHRTDSVYSFVRGKQIRDIYGIKGLSVPGQPIFARWSKLKKERIKIAMLGTDTAKSLIYARLATDNEDNKGRHHYPLTYDLKYFEGLISEEKKVEWSRGQPTIRWVKKEGQTKRNEPLDCRVYALAALRSLPRGQRDGLMRRRRYQLRMKEKEKEESKPAKEPTAAAKKVAAKQVNKAVKKAAKKAVKKAKPAAKNPRRQRRGGWSI